MNDTFTYWFKVNVVDRHRFVRLIDSNKVVNTTSPIPRSRGTSAAERRSSVAAAGTAQSVGFAFVM